MSIVIAFRVLVASLRGTEVAVYDYANANERILGNRSIILIRDAPGHNPDVIQKFTSRFPVFFYDPSDPCDIERILSKHECKILYTIGYGERRVNDPTLSPNGLYKTALHCVFTLNDPHADTYIPVSKYLAEKHGTTAYVPHMISIPRDVKGDMREQLGIPRDAIVFGRYGGIETFNIYFVHHVIVSILHARPTPPVYFLFANTHRFSTHERIIHLDAIVDPREKARFIQTCDAMIHARADGETFGIACGEFSMLNKPVITHRTMGDTSHISILGERCFTYTSEDGLYGILINFIHYKKEVERTLTTTHRDGFLWDAYSSEYGEKAVIELWWKYLIEPLL